MVSDVVVGMIDAVLSVFGIVELVLLGMTFIYLGKAAGAAFKGMAGHESTMAAGDHVRRWGRNLKKLDQRTREYNRLSNRLSVDMKRKDLEVEDKLEEIKKLLDKLEAIDNSPDLAHEPRGGA